MKAIGFAAGLLAVAASASAAPYDGSTPLKCAIETVLICSDPSICVRGTAQTVSLLSILTVDVGRSLVSGDASGRTIRITAVGHGAGRLMLHGEQLDVG